VGSRTGGIRLWLSLLEIGFLLGFVLPGLFTFLNACLGGFRAVPESVGLVAGLDDVAVVGQPAQQGLGLLASPDTLGHSAKAKWVVTMTRVRS
jgi:hypothetical protein